MFLKKQRLGTRRRRNKGRYSWKCLLGNWNCNIGVAHFVVIHSLRCIHEEKGRLRRDHRKGAWCQWIPVQIAFRSEPLIYHREHLQILRVPGIGLCHLLSIKLRQLRIIWVRSSPHSGRCRGDRLKRSTLEWERVVIVLWKWVLWFLWLEVEERFYSSLIISNPGIGVVCFLLWRYYCTLDIMDNSDNATVSFLVSMGVGEWGSTDSFVTACFLGDAFAISGGNLLTEWLTIDISDSACRFTIKASISSSEVSKKSFSHCKDVTSSFSR